MIIVVLIFWLVEPVPRMLLEGFNADPLVRIGDENF